MDKERERLRKAAMLVIDLYGAGAGSYVSKRAELLRKQGDALLRETSGGAATYRGTRSECLRPALVVTARSSSPFCLLHRFYSGKNHEPDHLGYFDLREWCCRKTARSTLPLTCWRG